MNQQLFNFILFCLLKRNNNQESYDLACLNAFRYALLLNDLDKHKQQTNNIGFWDSGEAIKPIVTITGEEFNTLFDNLKKLDDPALFLNNYFKTNFKYDECYCPPKDIPDISNNINLLVYESLRIATSLDNLAHLIKQRLSNKAPWTTQYSGSYKEYIHSQEHFYKPLINELIETSTQVARNIARLEKKKASAIVGIVTSVVLLAAAISLTMYPPTTVFGLAFLLVAIGFAVHGMNNAVEVLKTTHPPEPEMNLLKL